MTRHSKHHDGIGGTLGRIASAIAMAGAGVLALTQLPSLKRYLRMQQMSARHLTPDVGDARAASAAGPRWGTARWPHQG